ncbi:MAG: serine dehydratase beta chain, partial [Pseudothermotoga sp.]
MVGPSSSHTLGAMRISKFVHKMMRQIPKYVEFYMHGSFAKTFKGHGT